jgi:hypothetical protein
MWRSLEVAARGYYVAAELMMLMRPEDSRVQKHRASAASGALERV